MYFGKSVLELGTNSAILAFNDGSLGVSLVLKYFGIPNGYSFDSLSEKRDKERVASSIKKTDPEGKLQIKKIRAIKKGFIDDEKDKESFLSGGF